MRTFFTPGVRSYPPVDPAYQLERIDDDRLPEGWHIERVDRDDPSTGRKVITTLYVFETEPPEGERPKGFADVIRVEVFWGYPGHFQEDDHVSWPSTSDKRPVTARALAAALLIATECIEEVRG